MDIIQCEKGQGATEYLLILSAALVLSASAVSLVLAFREPSEEIIKRQMDNIEEMLKIKP